MSLYVTLFHGDNLHNQLTKALERNSGRYLFDFAVQGDQKQMTDFTTLTACGECCTGCPKKLDGKCPGCIETDGCVPEWAESGRCKVHACTREHHVQFCGLCAEFPCENLPGMIFWNPDITEKMIALRDEYSIQKG